MQLHIYNTIEAVDIAEFRECTNHKYDDIIKHVRDRASNKDLDYEIVSLVETVLNEAHPDKLIYSEYSEDKEYATWLIFDIPDEINNLGTYMTETPLETMPACINNSLKPIADIAKWRLKIGK